MAPPWGHNRCEIGLRITNGELATVSAGFSSWGVFPKFALENRPELLQEVASRVDAELHAELRDGLASSPIIRVVRVPDGNRCRVACYL
jgi:hypothetical protein